MASCLKAVHFRHLNIHEHKVVRDRFQRLERFLAVGNRVTVNTQFFENAQRDLLIGDVVFGNQYPGTAPRQYARRSSGGLTAGRASPREGAKAACESRPFR